MLFTSKNPGLELGLFCTVLIKPTRASLNLRNKLATYQKIIPGADGA